MHEVESFWGFSINENQKLRKEAEAVLVAGVIFCAI